MEKLTRHPLSAAWGDMPDADFDELVESVREHGFADPTIMVLDEQVLDGWHRYRAAQDLGLIGQLFYEELPDEEDAVQYVIRKNSVRRHLNAGQRVAAVSACYEWAKTGMQPGQQRDEQGQFTGGAPGAPPVERRTSTVNRIAKDADASETTVHQYRAAEDAGLGHLVRSGAMSAKSAARQARGEPDKPKGPTPVQRLEAERDALRMEVQEKSLRIEELEERVRFLEGELSEYPHEREATFNRQEAIISAQRAELATERSDHNELKRAHRGAIRIIRQFQEDRGDSATASVDQVLDEPADYDDPPPAVEDAEEPGEENIPVDTWEYGKQAWAASRRVRAEEDDPSHLGADELAADAWEESKWFGGFREGEQLVTDAGERVVFHGSAADGVRAMIGTENGGGPAAPIDLERLRRAEEGVWGPSK